MVEITNVRCEYELNPICIGTRKPSFGYNISSDEYGVLQKERRIVVSSSSELLEKKIYDLYDSGWEKTEESQGFIYKGVMLYSRQQATYRVLVKLLDDRILKSDLNYFTIGLLYGEDFKARFIRYQMPPKTMRPGTFDEGMPSPLMRKEFELTSKKRVIKAFAYVTALGSYRLRINGRAATDDVLAPGWTVFDRMQPYRCYDVTDLLCVGKNAIGAMLGDGWYLGSIGLFGREFYGGNPPALFFQLEVEFEDGSHMNVYSDDSWRAIQGPILYSDFFLGESYDARLEQEGWDLPGFDDSAWDLVNDCWYGASPARGELRPQLSPPMRINRQMVPVSMVKTDQGAYRFDLGQNIVGWVRFTLREPQAGQTLTFRFAEAINHDGTLYRENLRRAKNTDYYICKGSDREVFEPSFTYRGFRYVDVLGLTKEPELSDVVGCVVHSSFSLTGTFSCGEDDVNRLYENTLWSQIGNMLDVPTDCPQRDERWGCLTDALVFAKSACYNADMSRFYRKFSTDIFFSQWDSGEFAGLVPRMSALGVFAKPHEIITGEKHSAGTAGLFTGILLPYLLHIFYNETGLLHRYYADMERYMDFVAEFAPDFLVGGDSAGDPPMITIDGVGQVPHTAGGGDIMHLDDPTPTRVIDTAYYAMSAQAMEHISTVLGKNERSTYYKDLYQCIQQAFNGECVDSETGRIEGDSQTAYALALNVGLLSEDVQKKAAVRLIEKIAKRDGHLSTGAVGNGHLLPALCQAGYWREAYCVLLQREYPSWLYPVLKGATTIWERWDGYTDEKGFSTWAHDRSEPINSPNHYFLGCVCEWFYEYAGGIRPGRMGWKEFLIQPFTDVRLGYCRVSYGSIYGEIYSSWCYDGDNINYKIRIPANTVAMVELEGKEPIKILEGEAYLTKLPPKNGRQRFKVVSGNYSFQTKIPR